MYMYIGFVSNQYLLFGSCNFTTTQITMVKSTCLLKNNEKQDKADKRQEHNTGKCNWPQPS